MGDAIEPRRAEVELRVAKARDCADLTCAPLLPNVSCYPERAGRPLGRSASGVDPLQPWRLDAEHPASGTSPEGMLEVLNVTKRAWSS